jgi:hypothetical protein
LAAAQVIVLAGLSALIAACGSEVGTVGKPCSDSNDCPARLTSACIARWPDGYCTEVECSAGSCPEGSVCVRGIQFSNVPFNAFCLSTCSTADDCRSGYACADLGTEGKVCAPSGR